MLIKPRQPQSEVAIELTPIIDMVFLLLIFFLAATTFHQSEREMKIALPVAGAAEPISMMLREIVINVDAAGRIVVNGRELQTADLQSLITQAVSVNPDQKVTVRGDRQAAYAHIVAVLDICKGCGIQEPYLDTVLAE